MLFRVIRAFRGSNTTDKSILGKCHHEEHEEHEVHERFGFVASNGRFAVFAILGDGEEQGERKEASDNFSSPKMFRCAIDFRELVVAVFVLRIARIVSLQLGRRRF
jgi:hypothetical protein